MSRAAAWPQKLPTWGWFSLPVPDSVQSLDRATSRPIVPLVSLAIIVNWLCSSRRTCSTANRAGGGAAEIAPALDPIRIRGVVAVLQREGAFLLIQRAAHLRAGGGWCFPGGTIEPGEAPSAAVARECREELNLAVEPVKELWVTRRDGLHLRWWLVQAERAPVQPNPEEVSDFRWLRIDQLGQIEPRLPGIDEFFERFGPSLVD